jgi:nucleoid-associated protein YgaU
MTEMLTQSRITELLLDLGIKNTRQARIGSAIALCEAPGGRSDTGEHQADFSLIGDQELANDIWGYSYGGFQIRSLRSEKGTGGKRDEEQLLRPRFNCRSAIVIKREWGGWGAWSTYTSGMYRAYLQDMYPPPINTYVVLGGDTLMSIAAEYARTGSSWTWEDLARVNNLHSPYTIYIGQYLTLP